MSYIIFFILLAIACFCICRIPFIKRSGLSTRVILILFLVKVAAGLANGYITEEFGRNSSDNWALNALSFSEYHLLLADPAVFLKELFVSNYNGGGYDNMFGSFGSFWNDLENNILAKSLAPFNVISRNNYYINSIVFNFFGFFGHIALFRLFTHLYMHKRTVVLAGAFFLPTALFFNSSLSKDNVVFTFLAMFCFCLYFYTLSGFTWRRTAWLLFFFAGVLLMRNHIALLLVPPAVSFFLSFRLRVRPAVLFAGCIALLLVLLLVVPPVVPSLNPAAVISHKQQDFLALGIANTQIPINAVEPNSISLLQNMPQAFVHGFFRPWITDIQSGFVCLQFIEIACYLLFFLLAAYYFIRSGRRNIHPFVLFCFFFVSMVYIMNGYIVPNTNTLVRYRSIYLPLIITPLLCNVPLLNRLNQIKI
ncbi:MAG: hypothetical protein QM687_11270 [Ferruginibacter sp.]